MSGFGGPGGMNQNGNDEVEQLKKRLNEFKLPEETKKIVD